MLDQSADVTTSRKLMLQGAILFLFGLLNGVVIQLFSNPRAGLSAHLAGVQNGMVLLIVGLVWPKLVLTRGWAKAKYWLWLHGMYSIWIGLVLAAALGTSRSTPIAGKGRMGGDLEEGLVYALIGSGVVTTLAAGVLLVVGLRLGRQPLSSGHQ